MQNELFIIDSPCIGVCAMNKKGYCMGCFRNRTERQTWHTLSDGDKVKILKTLAKRQRNIKAFIRQKNLSGQSDNYEFDFFAPSEQLSLAF